MNCKHCGEKISRWDSASFWMRREIFTHDDLVDGATDAPRDGVDCADGQHEAEPMEKAA